MDNLGGMVDSILEGAVEMREGFRAAAEPHVGAEVVPTLDAVCAPVAHDAGFDRDSLTDFQM
jgi:hypothetical protein